MTLPKPSSAQRLAAKPSGFSCPNTRPAPHFKKGGKGRFLRSVYQALLENAEDCDSDLFAHLADSSLAPDDVDEPSHTPELHDSDNTADEEVLDDSAAHALAAIGLDQLLNW